MSEDNKQIVLDYLSEYDKDIKITDGYYFNLKKTVNRIELYRSSRFESGTQDSQGNKKYFFNIVNPQCGHATKSIDIDRKDIRIRATDGNDYTKAQVYNAELKDWLRGNNFGLTLNRISEELPIYGSVFLKKQKDEVVFVPVRNLIFDPAVSSIQGNYDVQSSYIIEKHYMQPHELEQMTAWDKEGIDIVADAFRKQGKDKTESDICVYEFYNEFTNEELGLSGDGYSRGVLYIAIGEGYNEVLFKKKLDKFPYKKIDYITIPGRGLGLGIYEMLFDSQTRWNEMANQKALSMRTSSKHIFQTKDTTIESNILTDTLDGDIIKVNSEITPIVNEERNLSAYAQEENNLMTVVRNLTNAYESITGETLPGRTPFRLGLMMQESAGKLFQFIRQNIGMFLEEVLTEWVLPTFDEAVLKEHVFELHDNEAIMDIFEKDVNRRMNEALKKMVAFGGVIPTRADVDMLKEQLMQEQKPVEFVKIAKDWLKFDKKIYVDVSGEQINANARIETFSNLLQLLAQNPQMVQLPETKGLFTRMLEELGVNQSLIGSSPAPTQPPVSELGASLGGAVPLAR